MLESGATLKFRTEVKAKAPKRKGGRTKEGRKEGRKERRNKDDSWQEAGGGEGGVSLYLAEDDVDHTADHHQSIEDVPGVPDIALITAA